MISLKGDAGVLLFYNFIHLLIRQFLRPWKMYPLGVLFGLGFDTSSEIAILGISSIQAARGTSIWVIMIFPIIFTGKRATIVIYIHMAKTANLSSTPCLAGMCLIDTIDGALMLSLYIQPAQNFLPPKSSDSSITAFSTPSSTLEQPQRTSRTTTTNPSRNPRDPIAFLYYSIVLTSLTVIVAVVIGILQLLTMILNVTAATGRFWDGVETAGKYYDVIGGSICGCFILFGGLSVLVYPYWRRWVAQRKGERQEHGVDGILEEGRGDGAGDETDYGIATTTSTVPGASTIPGGRLKGDGGDGGDGNKGGFSRVSVEERRLS